MSLVLLTDWLRTISRRGLNILLPARCIGCGVNVEQAGALCVECWGKIQFISKPSCFKCGTPFPYHMGDNAICGGCMESPPLYDRAVSAFLYDDASRKLITRFKYGDQIHSARTLTEFMFRAGQDFLWQGDVIVPVPLHPIRLLKRRYNQSALLAQILSHQSDVPYNPSALVRSRHIPPQASLQRNKRQKNVKGAFDVPVKQQEYINGKIILLVDDVVTTGATLNECARVLKKAGAAKVFVLTLAKTVEME